MTARLAALGLVLLLALPTGGTASAEPHAYRAQFVLLTANGAADPAKLRAVEDSTPALLDAWSQATRGLVTIERAGPARALAAHDPDRAWLATRAFFADPHAPRDAQLLILIADDDVPLASPACACVAWSERVTSAGPLGPALDQHETYGAPQGFLAIVGLAHLHELADDRDEVAYRFLHEVAHAWCCRVERAPPSLLAPRGAHWSAGAHDLGAPVTDPLAGDGSEGHARGVAWRFTDVTLVTLGALSPDQARTLVTRDGRAWSTSEILGLAIR